MAYTQSFLNSRSPTPKLIKYLVIAALVAGCLAGFFHSMLGIKLGISFVQLFSLSITKILKGFIWQPFTFLFMPHLEGTLSFYFLFSLCFDLYLLWFVGCKVHRYFGPKTTLKLFFIPPAIGCILASLLGLIMHVSTPLFGLSFAMIPLITAFAFSTANSQVNFMPMQALQTRWMGLGLVILYLLQDLANLNFISFIAHILVAAITYFYLLYFHTLRSPFSFTQKLDDFILSKKRKPTSSKIIYLYDEEIRKEKAMDKTFDKIKNNEKLSVLDKFKLRRYRRKSRESSKN
ncbi:MAG: hypothetical protein S4CHLAM6_08850 [Chlamydiae bacterium]|nr:hypothetical protein [Chlamydiota bacterium]